MVFPKIRIGALGVSRALDRVGSSAKKNLEETRSRGESLELTMEELNKTVSKSTERMRLFGIIGLGTLAALFVNTPILVAGFAMVKAALLELFLTLQDKVMPVFEIFSAAISKFAAFLEANPALKNLLATLVAMGVAAALLVVLLFPIWTIFMGLTAIVTKFIGLALGIHAFVTAFGMMEIAIDAVMLRLGGLWAFFGRGVALIMAHLGTLFRAIVSIFGSAIGIALIVIAGLVRNWEEAVMSMGKIFEGIKGVFRGISEFLLGAFTLDWRRALNGLVGAWLSSFTMMKGSVDLAFDALEGILLILQDITNWVLNKLGFEKTNILGKLVDDVSAVIGIGAERRVGDAIISPGGSVITTDPRDYLIATTDPGSLLGGGTATDITVSFEGAQIVLSDALDISSLADEMASQISDKMRRVA